MADKIRKEYEIHIGGLKESVDGTKTLNDALGEQKKQYKSTSDAMQHYYDVQDKVNKNNQESAKTNKEATNALKEMNKEIKSIQGEMVGLEQGSKQWKELAQQAGALKDKVDDARSAIKRYASDAKVLDDVINIAKSATSAFQLYKGAMSLFGVETEEAEKAMQKLVGAMSIIQSLQTLQNTLKGCTATADLFNVAMKVTGGQLVANQLASIKATVAQEGLSKAQKVGAVAAKTFGLALKAIPLMLVIGLITELVLHWEDFCGWLDKTFPALKKVGGAMNALKGVIVGVGKAVLHWLVNPWETFAKVIKKIMEGDFKGAISEAVNGAKNQFTGMGDAFKEGFQNQVEKGLEDITKKQAEESNKQTKQQLEELKIQERNNKTYSKKYIDLQKKDFAERKKMAKGNQEELNKIKLEEMKFYADIEDKKTAAAKAGASERAKAAKEAAKEAAEAAKAEAEQEKRLLTAQRALRDEIINNEILKLKERERFQNLRLEGFDSGPLEKYIEELGKLNDLLYKIYDKERAIQLSQIGDYLQDNITIVKKSSIEWQEYIASIKSASGITFQFTEEQKKALISQGKTVKEIASLEKEELNKIITEWQKVEGLRWKSADNINARIIDNEKKSLSVMKNEMSDYADDFERRYKLLIEKVNAIGKEQVERNNIWGTIQTGKTLANLEILKTQWEEAYVDLSAIIKKEEERWEAYLNSVESLYGLDSSAFKKAQKEKEDALDSLNKKLNEVWKRSETPTSTEIDYTGDNQASASTKPNRTLWDKDSDFLKNMSNLFDSLDEMVLAPAMDTFAMFMDFAIEETQQRLEEVEKMHDDALDKVEESADKIQELNDKLKDSSNTNIEVTKQQLADEQILYAQRLAEERKLADEEKSLRNKAAQQEANARKMELRYQMVMSVANTAQGVSKTLAEWPYPLSAIFAALQGALGAVQTALIAKQIGTIKPVKYAEGGLLEGPSHKQGGIRIPNTNIEVEGKEFVVNKRSTKKYLPLLEAINAEGRKSMTADKKIRRFANGGQVNFERVDETLNERNNTNRLLNAIDKIDFQPVVAVKDIWKVEDRLVKVRSLAGK